MQKIHCGPVSASFDIGNDGIVRSRWSGLVVPSNAGAVSAMVLDAGALVGARGVIANVAESAVALPPLTADHYDYVPDTLRGVPVAIVVSLEQLAIYGEVATEAALSGAMRRAFLSRDQAEAWLRSQVQALAANRLWWSTRRSPQ